ncbi:MAG: type IV secretory pathway TrbD component [Natronomonas sp.]|jgi:hypothetical protein
MLLDVLSGYPLVRAFIVALFGVGFWVAGLVAANWLWEYLRGDSDGSGE